MARIQPTQAADKWSRNLAGAGESIKAGVSNVTVSPGVLAARQVEKWFANVTASKDKWQRRVGAVQLADWQAAMIDTGVSRIAQGATQKKGKYEAFANEFFPFLDRVTAQTKQMPSTTLEDRLNRMVSQARSVSAFKRGAAA